MDHPIEPSILAAIDQGRGQRGGKDPQAWSRRRAQLLMAASQGMTRIRIAGAFGLSQGAGRHPDRRSLRCGAAGWGRQCGRGERLCTALARLVPERRYRGL